MFGLQIPVDKTAVGSSHMFISNRIYLRYSTRQPQHVQITLSCPAKQPVKTAIMTVDIFTAWKCGLGIIT